LVRRTSLILSEIVAGLLAGLIALGGIAAWRLNTGPVPLDFLTPHLETALNAGGRGYTIDIDRTVAVWAGWRNAIDIRATGVLVTAPDGTTLMRVPELSLGLSLRALARGQLAPTSLDALRPSVRVVRHSDGAFSFAFAEAAADPLPPDEGAGGGLPAFPEDGEGVGAGDEVVRFLIDELLSDPDPTRTFGYLRRISIFDARIFFDDRVAGTSFWSPDAQVVLLKSAEGVVGDISLVLRHETRQTDMRASIALGRLDSRFHGNLSFRNLRLADFAASMPQIAPLTAVRMPLDGRLEFFGALGEAVERVDFDLAGGAGKLDIPELYRDPLPVSSLRIRGTARDNLRDVVIDPAEIDLGGPKVTARASIASGSEDTALALSGRLVGMPMARLDRYWPPSLAPSAYDWVTTHMTSGVATEATIEMALRRRADDPDHTILESLGGTLVYSGLSVDYYRPMPLVTDVSGSGTFDQDGLYLGVAGGTVGDTVNITGGQVDITGLTTLKTGGRAMIAIDAMTEGRVQDVVAVLDHEPLKLGRKLGFDPDRLDGAAKGHLRFEFPLINGLTTDMLEIRAGAKIESGVVRDGPFGITVTEGMLGLDLTQDSMTVAGDAKLNGVPARVEWHERLRGTKGDRRRFLVSSRVDAGQRRALGLPDLGYWLEGPARMDLDYTVGDGAAAAQIKLRADLVDAVVKMPEIGWRKEAGVAGTVAIEGTAGDGSGLVFDSFRLASVDMDALARMEFLPDLSDIAKVTLHYARYRGSNIEGEITRTDEGGYRVDVHGPHIDVRHFLQRGSDVTDASVAGEPEAAGRPFFVRARFDEAQTGDDRRVYNAVFTGKYSGRHWQAARTEATLAEGGSLTLAYEPAAAGGYDLEVRSSDAGQALRSLNWWDEIQGGSMVIRGHRASIGGPLTGTFTVKDYRLTEAPAGIKVLQLLTLVGLPSAMGSKGLEFVSLDAGYTLDNGLLTFGEVETYGSTIGIHLEKGGWMDFDKGNMDVQGVLVPANTAQKFIGAIPLLGPILTLGEGLFATEFRIYGPLDKPTPSVNPISTFAPGFLRKLFRAPGPAQEGLAPTPPSQSD